MLGGWYCRSMAGTSVDEETGDEDESQDEIVNYKEQYKNLKRKLKYLIYENESFQETLRSAQRRLMIVSQDRSFLLDRLLLYEQIDNSSSESEETESSDDPDTNRVDIKKKRTENTNANYSSSSQSVSGSKTPTSTKKKKVPAPKVPKNVIQSVQTLGSNMAATTTDGHMTPEEVERHLQSRQTYMELVPEIAPPTVPTEMFSNDPSLDSESNDMGELETSPSNMGEDLSIDMVVE